VEGGKGAGLSAGVGKRGSPELFSDDCCQTNELLWKTKQYPTRGSQLLVRWEKTSPVPHVTSANMECWYDGYSHLRRGFFI